MVKNDDLYRLLESWEGLLLETDVSTTCTEAIFAFSIKAIVLKAIA